MTRALVLGGGMVGEAIAMDLAREPGWTITVADRDPGRLQQLAARYGVRTHVADLATPAPITALARAHDIVVGALSSHLGLATLRAVVAAERDHVDISFMAEDPSVVSAEATRHGVTAVVDCGVGPGLSNMLVGHAVARLQPCRRIEILVGGLPVQRRWPWEYKAAFAPADVIEEYVRPARIVVNGRVVVRQALSDPELVDLPGVGTLEAFHTDGLRSLVSLPVPDVLEKTLRYPGHIERMRVLRELGLFSDVPIEVGGQSVVPRDVTARLLFPQWSYDEGEADLTVMRIDAHGDLDGEPVCLRWDLLDHRDAATGLRSMSRTTGFPAAIMTRMVAGGRFCRPGVHAPEVCGAESGLVDEMLAGLAERGVNVQARVLSRSDEAPTG